MKKFISTILSAALSVSAIASIPCSAAEKVTAASKSGMVLLGDSIATGYTRKGDVAHNYGEICGDYLGCKVSNYAVVGDTTDDMLTLIDGMNAEQKKNISDAEYVVISIGGNDIMQYIAKGLIDFALSKPDQNFFNEGYTAADIPKNPSMSTLTTVLNINSILSYANSGIRAQIELSSLFGDIGSNLSYKNENYEGYIETHIIPNIKKAADKVKAVNPDAKIMVQTIYQPVQFDPTYIEKTYGKKSSTATFISLLRSQMETVMGSYSQNLNTIDGIDVVDVKAEFTSYDGSLSTDNPGNANYFVDVQTGGLSTMDVHPNQKGHLAIAAAILNKIGKLHVDDGLLTEVYKGITDKDKYPAIAYATYKKVAGEPKVTTTTTTTTTTSKTTTTTTKTTTTTSKPTTTTTSKTTTTTSKPTTTTSKTTTTTTLKPTTTTTTTTAPANNTKYYGAIFINKPEKTEYTVGDKVDYTGAKFHYTVEAENGSTHATGGKEHKFEDISENIFTENYVLEYSNIKPETFVITLDRSKVDTSKAGTYKVTAKLTNKDGSKVYGTDSFEIVVKAPENKLGDINNDGLIDSVDASGILAEYARLSSNDAKGKFTDAQGKAADVDKNGLIDSVDASKVLAYYAYVSNTDNAKTIEEYLKTVKK
ncbi:GDSL-type esterase/lipase family protein [Ruminococcus flavefaciens]|uniref:GDSL-type esterase/lipase family protein n=1 Tax=Ruminococcus flavefaciens TaxID=1265 RepID=UPI000491DEFF|nr:GDSL-type esterase/lipase family protein [Ruminococcus flavefaciens]